MQTSDRHEREPKSVPIGRTGLAWAGWASFL